MVLVYEVFKHRVRAKLPNKIRFATVCKRCSETTNITERCWTCKLDEAKKWDRPY